MNSYPLRKIAKDSLIYGVGSVAQSSLGFLLLPVLTGQLSRDDFGAYSLIMLICSAASAIFYFGITSALPRSYFDYPEGEQRKAIYTTGLCILLVGAILQTAIGIWLSSDLALLLLHQESAIYSESIAWALLGGALIFINQYLLTYLRLLGYSLSFVVLNILGMILGIVLTLWLLEVRNQSLTAPFEAIVYSQAITITAFLAMYGKNAITLHLSYIELKHMLYFGLSAVIASFGAILMEQADRIIIQNFLSLADVGLYSAIVKVSSLVNIVLILPFTQMWSPMMMEHRKSHNIKKLTSNMLSYFLFAGTLLITLVTLFTQDLLTTLIHYEINQKFFLVFLILALSNLLLGTTNIIAAGIFYERKIYLFPIVYYSIAVLKIGLNLLLIPRFGIIAAAACTLFTSTLLPTIIYILASRYFWFPIEWLRLLKLALVIGLLTGYIIINIFIPNLATHWILKPLILFLIITILTTSFLSKSERDSIRGTLTNIFK